MRKTVVTTLVLLTLGFAALSQAEPAPEDAAKYRQAVMKALSGHNGALRLIVADRAGNAAKLTNHIEALANLADEVGDVFQAGSDLDDDEALPAIWENPDAFANAVTRFEEAAAALKTVAANNDIESVNSALKDFGDACKGCHEDFRLDD